MMALVFSVAALALASGIGGGGLYVPMLNLLLRFRPHVAVGLSQALICGGALGALLVNGRAAHPKDASGRTWPRACRRRSSAAAPSAPSLSMCASVIRRRQSVR